MTAIAHPPRPGPPGRGTGWVVTTDASPARAAAVTGTTGWRRPRPGALARRAFAAQDAAQDAIVALRGAAHSSVLAKPIVGTAVGSSGPRVRADVWAAAETTLAALDGPRAVTVTVTPTMSRSGAVTAFLRALNAAAQVSAGESS